MHWSRILLLGLAVAPSASAQNAGLVVRDGTLGSAAPGIVASGVDEFDVPAHYLIRADLGEQRGRSLFHSFERFSIGADETATFTAQGAPQPGAIDHVISRVTGGEASELHGTLRSTIPGADVWLLNPAGLVFGHGARLDVPAGFRAGTASELRFDTGEVFEASAGGALPVLSVARPAEFGFLGDASIEIRGELEVGAAGISFAAGDELRIGGGDGVSGSSVSLEADRIVIESDAFVSAYQSGSRPDGEPSFDGGEIVLSAGNRIDILGQVTADAVEGRGGSITATAGEAIHVAEGGWVSASSWDDDYEVGDGLDPILGGLVSLEADRVQIDGAVTARSEDAGTNGSIEAAAGELLVGPEGRIDVGDRDTSQARGGFVDLVAAERARIYGSILALGDLESGSVRVESPSVEVLDEGEILVGGHTSLGGDLTILAGANGRVRLGSDARLSIFTEARSGTLHIEGGFILLEGLAFVSDGRFEAIGRSIELSSTALINAIDDYEDGGSVLLTASDVLAVEGEIRVGESSEGLVLLEAPRLSVSGTVASRGRNALLSLVAGEVIVDGAILSAESLAGRGGTILVQASEFAVLRDSEITASVERGDDGGNVTIASPAVVLDAARVTARSPGSGGLGGQIRIVADALVMNSSTSLDASAGSPELSGVVQIDAPEVDIEGSVAALTDVALDASDRVVPSCSARRRGETAGSFVVAGASLPRGPEGWLDAWSGSAAPEPFARLAGGCP